MHSEFQSLPESLAAEIQELADQMLPQSRDQSRVNTCPPPLPEPHIHRAMLEVARSSPELFATMLLGALGVDGLEIVEVQTTFQDRRVEQQNGTFRYSEVVPFRTVNTVRREVRLTRSKRGGRT